MIVSPSELLLNDSIHILTISVEARKEERDPKTMDGGWITPSEVVDEIWSMERRRGRCPPVGFRVAEDQMVGAEAISTM